MGSADRVDPVDLVGRANRLDLADRLDPADRADRVGLADRDARHPGSPLGISPLPGRTRFLPTPGVC